MNRQELAALAEVCDLLDELLTPVCGLPGDNRRLAAASTVFVTLAVDLRVAAQHRNTIPDWPLRELRLKADRLRAKLAELEADRVDRMPAEVCERGQEGQS